MASWQSPCEGDDETVVEIMASSYREKSIFVNESLALYPLIVDLMLITLSAFSCGMSDRR